MNFKTNSNLTIHVLYKVNALIGQTLVDYSYYDTYAEEYLSTNNNGIHIIAHQLKLDFTNKSIYVSWHAVEDWSKYSLVVSDTSFCENEGIEMFKKADANWDKILEQKILDYNVYGYKENLILSKRNADIFVNEPHLLIFEFENFELLGIGNFYFEDKFIPTLPMGDDVWIIFGSENLQICIDSLQLDKLEK